MTAEEKKLRARIAALTKREPRDGVGVEYLRNRLAMLERRHSDGDNVRESLTTGEERTRPQSISLTETQGEALAKLCDKTKMKASALVRAALAHYAYSRGHNTIARTFDEKGH